MRRTVAMLAMAVALAGPAAADEAAVRGVIGAQIEAFLADDFEGAFAFAAPNIKGIFRTPGNFGRMVVQGYPMVHRPADVEYLRSEAVGGGWAQEILVEDGAGRLHKLLYRMVETPEGWRIAGVQVLTLPEVGA